jgi:cation-transporting ATPase F
VAGEIAYLFTCRSLTGPVRAMGIASNRLLLAGVAVMVALQVAMTYAPPMNALFGSTPVAAWTWAAAAGAGVAVAAAVMMHRRRASSASGVEWVE